MFYIEILKIIFCPIFSLYFFKTWILSKNMDLSEIKRFYLDVSCTTNGIWCYYNTADNYAMSSLTQTLYLISLYEKKTSFSSNSGKQSHRIRLCCTVCWPLGVNIFRIPYFEQKRRRTHT